MKWNKERSLEMVIEIRTWSCPHRRYRQDRRGPGEHRSSLSAQRRRGLTLSFGKDRGLKVFRSSFILDLAIRPYDSR